MKKLTFFAMMTLIGSNLIAQTTNTFPPNGNVGIGTTTPVVWFPGKVLEFRDTRPIIRLTPLAEGGLATILLKGAYNTAAASEDEFHINYVSSIAQPRIVIGAYKNSANGNDIFTIMGNGNIGVGVSIPTDKFAVNGLIRAKEVKVEVANWPDYVFKPGFQLTALSEVERYISDNGHLPAIPSAEQIGKEGLSLGEMNKLLLKKIEELTLYLIEKDKQAKYNQQQFDKLKTQVELLLSSKDKQ